MVTGLSVNLTSMNDELCSSHLIVHRRRLFHSYQALGLYLKARRKWMKFIRLRNGLWIASIGMVTGNPEKGSFPLEENNE